MNAYDVLEISPDADEKQIKAAFKKLAKKYHPDLNGGDKAAEAKFKEINEAYSMLTDKSQSGARMGQEFNFNVNAFEAMFDTMFRQSRTINRVHLDPELFIRGGTFAHRFQTLEQHNGMMQSRQHLAQITIEPDTPILSQVVVPGTQPNHIFLQLVPGNTPKYSVENFVHLVERKTIDVFQAMVGGSIDVVAPNGKEIKVKFPPGTQQNTIHRLRGLGLKLPDGGRGDYHIHFAVTIPTLTGSDEDIKKQMTELLQQRLTK